MKITVLGCGCSGGVPLIGDVWGDCDPKEPRNVRLRPSVLVEGDGGETLLVDTSPDMREQLLRCGLKTMTAVFFTHAHADHCHGIDNLRSVNWLIKNPVPVYASKETMEELTCRFDYIFSNPNLGHFCKPSLTPNVIDAPVSIGVVVATPIEQMHGQSRTTGYRFNDFAYSTDVSDMPEESFDALSGIKVWILDCARERPHPTHLHLEKTLQWIERVKPEYAYLTHMDQTMDYATIKAKLPKGVEPAYDGLVIEC